MRFCTLYTLLASGLLVLAGSQAAFSQRVPVKALERAVKNAASNSARTGAGEAGILGAMEIMHEEGEQLAAALKREAASARAKASLERLASTSLAQKMREVQHVLQTPVVPTASDRLPALGHPFIGRESEFSQLYAEFMQEFLDFRKDFNGRVFYEPVHVKMHPEEVRRWIIRLSGIQARLRWLKKKAYPQDEPLSAAVSYLALAAGEINPMLKGTNVPLVERTSRRYERAEFLLEEGWFNQVARMAWPAPKAELPANLKVAVVNDEEHALMLYRAWQNQGVFKDWEITYYKRTDPLLKDVFSGKHYDLVLSDLQVAESSVEYTVSRLRAAGITVPVILCSSYTTDSIRPDLMFRQGFDGYVSWSDIASGGVNVLTDALKRYFFYRDYYKWSR